MKRRILALTMCLALTATTALAQSPGIAKKTIPHSKSAAVAATAKPQTNTSVEEITKQTEPAKVISREEAKKRFEQRQAKERELLYSALNLTNEQKAKAEELDAKTRAEARNYIKKLHEENRKLRDLKAKKASFFAIYKQEFVTRKAKSDADKFFNNSKKSFEAILNEEQKTNFKKIDAERKKQMEKFRKEHKPGEHGMYKGPHGPMPMGGPGMGPKGPMKKGEQMAPPPPPPEDQIIPPPPKK